MTDEGEPRANQLSQPPPQPLSEPIPQPPQRTTQFDGASTGFCFQRPYVANLGQILEAFPEIQQSQSWISERQSDVPGLPIVTTCVSAFVAPNEGEDIDFIIRTSWQGGLERITSMKFSDSLEVVGNQ